jgi:hypothetical protein
LAKAAENKISKPLYAAVVRIAIKPDQFIADLKALPRPVSKAAEVRGYKVKRSVPKLTTEEQQQCEDIANQMMTEAMRPRS